MAQNWKKLGALHPKENPAVCPAMFSFSRMEIGFWYFLIAHCFILFGRVVLFGDCLFTLLSVYTDESLKSLFMGPKHCDEILPLRVLDGKN